MSSILNRSWVLPAGIVLFAVLGGADAFAACDHSINSVPWDLTDAETTYCLTQDITTGSGDFTIKADSVTLDGQGHSVTVASDVVSTFKHDGVTVQNLKLKDGGITVVYQNGAQGLKILDNELTGILILEATGITIRGNTVAGGLGIAGRGQCIYADNRSACDPYSGDHLTRKKLMVVDLWSDDNVVENNSFHGEGMTDVRFVQVANQRGLKFRNNHVEISNSSGNIIQIHYTIDSTFEGNTILSDIDPSKAGETYGVTVRDDITRLTFRNNYVRSNGTNCMLLGGSGNEAFIEGFNDTLPNPWGYGNLVEANVFLLESSSLSDAAIRFDTSNGGDRFVNNLVYSEQGGSGALRIGAIPPADNPTVLDHNTAVSLNNGPALNLMEGTDQNGLTKLTNNIFYQADPRGVSAQGSTPTADTDYNLYFPSSADFLSREPHSFSADPLFVDAANSDFHLSTDPRSPAIGAGNDGKDLGAESAVLEMALTGAPASGSGAGVEGGCRVAVPSGYGSALLLWSALALIALRRRRST
ncbi:MAG: right-handed parallel beta-helix repeat-containing protein [Pseudomonadota bacterium]